MSVEGENAAGGVGEGAIAVDGVVELVEEGLVEGCYTIEGDMGGIRVEELPVFRHYGLFIL